MAKKFIIGVEEGMTRVNKKCTWQCPFAVEDYGVIQCGSPECFDDIDCDRYNLATMKIEDYNENEIKKDIIEKAAEWIKTHWREYINGPNKDGCISFGHWENDFKKAMEE